MRLPPTLVVVHALYVQEMIVTRLAFRKAVYGTVILTFIEFVLVCLPVQDKLQSSLHGGFLRSR